jgi:hypothetical protein
VTFSAVPSTYTDLVLRISVRTDETATAFSTILLTFNGSSASNYSRTFLRGNGVGTVSSQRTSNAANVNLAQASDAVDAASNTFGNGEIYIPNYTVTANKPLSAFTVQEDNSTTAFIAATAGLRSVTDAITSLTLTASASNFVSGSSFYLYGIKNS